MLEQIVDDVAERRKSLRLDMENHLVSILGPNEGQTKQVVCVDVCNSGISLNLDAPLDVDAEIFVILNPADSDSPKRKGKVLRCVKQDSGWYQIGLHFIK